MDVAYALKYDETRDSDQASLSAYIARGADVDTVTDHLASDGSVALFRRALDEADPVDSVDDFDIPDESDADRMAAITNLRDWANQVNGQI